MRAVVCPAIGAPPLVTEVPSPTLVATGQVRIKVAAAGINFADTLMLAGKYQVKPAAPFVLGLELSGWVTELGDGVAGLEVGDPVVALVDGGAFAEEAVAKAGDVFKLAAHLDLVAAAGFPIAYGTSHLALAWKAALQPGEVLVVHGAGSGVGLTAVEIGALLGAEVIATAGGPDKLAVAMDLGAHHGIDSRAEDVRERIKEITRDRGADVVYDPVGGKMFDASLRAIAPDGRILAIGFASGEVPQIPANILLVKNVTVIGFYWGAYRRLNPPQFRKSMTELIEWWSKGLLAPRIGATFPMAEAENALALLKSRKVAGKIVLTMGG